MLLPKSEGPLVRELEKENISFEVLKMPDEMLDLSRGTPIKNFIKIIKGFPFFVQYFLRLICLLKKKNPVLIQSNGIKCHIISSLISCCIKKPIFWHLRDIISSGSMLSLLKFLKKRKNIYLIANSQATAVPFVDGKKNPIVYYNGFDFDRYVPNPSRFFNEQNHWPKEVQVVGILGALARWKGQVEFLRMAKNLIQSGSNASFVVIGDEIYDTLSDQGFKSELLELSRSLGIQDRVCFAGFQRESIRAINGLDVLVHASIKPEPFGRVIVEAMACGVPVVCSAAGGVLEIVDNEKTGLLYTPGNIEEMSDQVKKILTNPSLRERLRSEALKKVRMEFEWVGQIKKITSLYDSIIG